MFSSGVSHSARRSRISGDAVRVWESEPRRSRRRGELELSGTAEAKPKAQSVGLGLIAEAKPMAQVRGFGLIAEAEPEAS